ncbi:MAG: HAMP domain-containing histidine kinase [Ruminococcus sp.]|nr:HAMP domain-containing histidine kinase [Ruminococcus sp.]
MKNKKTCCYKFYRLSYFIIISVIVFIGVLIVTINATSYKKSKLSELQNNGDLFLRCVKEEYRISGNITSDSIKRLHAIFSKENKLTIYIYDEEGNCRLSDADYTAEKGFVTDFDGIIIDNNGNPSEKEEVKPLSKNMISTLDDGDYLDFDNNNFSSKKPSLLYGTRFFLRVNELTESSKMYILIYGKADSLNGFIFKIIIYYVIFAVISVYLASLLLRKNLKKYAGYENDFLKVSEMYAKGDFSEKLRTDIDGTLKEIAEYINALAANVEKGEEKSKTFIANVSHELRTPMTTIGGFVDGILDGTIPKSRQNEYLVLVSKEIKRLRILITSMLSMTRFESGTMRPNFKPTNLTDLVIQTVLMFEKKIEDKMLEVEGLDSNSLVAVVDSDLMQQVIYNIVENAVKFVNERGTLTFRFEKADGLCILSIKNTGEGLQNSEIQQVFDRFYKTDSSRGKDTTGLGLGLSISRKIVHLHKGHIVVKSVYGEYTEFQVQIPENLNRT